MKQIPYLEIHTILAPCDAYGTEKIKINEEALNEKGIEYFVKLLQFRKKFMHYIFKKCPEGVKKGLSVTIAKTIKENNMRVFVYELKDEIRKIEIYQEDTCLICILQDNVFFSPDLQPKEVFYD